MNSWIAHTDFAHIERGTRLYIMERMYESQTSRPPYTLGDSFALEKTNQFEVAGKILDVKGAAISVELTDGTTFTAVPTPAGGFPPALVTPIPFDDYTVV